MGRIRSTEAHHQGITTWQKSPRPSSTASTRSPSKPARSPARPAAPSWSRATAPCCWSPQCANKTAREGQDFFPLTVDYQEKFYAGGRIPGGFFKREGRQTEKETLISRLIDRPIRPLFPEGFRNEVQVIATVMSMNPEVDGDIPALIGASAALSLSGAPFDGPIGAAKVGYKNGQYLLNPTVSRAEGFRARARRRRYRQRGADGRIRSRRSCPKT